MDFGPRFRSRIDVLNDLIELYQCLDSPNNRNLMDDTESLEWHCPIVRSFIFNEIENFSKLIIEGGLEMDNFDYEFANKLYEFDKRMFETKLKNAIETLFHTIAFDDILKTVSGFNYYCQAAIGYEAIFQKINLGSDDSKESYDLSDKLQELITRPTFAHLTGVDQSRVTDIAKQLPLNFEHLCRTSKLLITNLGNGCHLYVEMVKKDDVIFPTLTFGPKQICWIVHHDITNQLFEFESPNGQLLCWVKPYRLLRILGRILPPETVFMDKNEATNTKWKIEQLEAENPLKGFIIKAAEHSLYLSGARNGEFSNFVSELKQLDMEQSERCAWKFQRIDYF